jgi:hypothetical protein
MAWPEIAVINNTTPVMNTLQDQKSLKHGEFGFKLSQSDSVLYLGTADPVVSGIKLNSIPVTQKGFWQVELDSVKVQGGAIVSHLPAIIDTGSTLIIGDTKSVDAIYKSIPGSRPANSLGEGVYTCKCSSLPVLVENSPLSESDPCDSSPLIALTFGQVDYDISKSFNFGQAANGSSDCLGGIVASDNLACT